MENIIKLKNNKIIEFIYLNTDILQDGKNKNGKGEYYNPVWYKTWASKRRIRGF